MPLFVQSKRLKSTYLVFECPPFSKAKLHIAGRPFNFFNAVMNNIYIFV